MPKSKKKNPKVETISNILKKLDRNNGNLSQTAKETGYARQTIMRWRDTFAPEKIKESHPPDVRQAEASIDIATQRLEFESDALRVKRDILKRIENALPNTRSVLNLTKALKTVAEVEGLSINARLKPLGDGDAPPQTNAMVFINTIIQQIKINNQKKNE